MAIPPSTDSSLSAELVRELDLYRTVFNEIPDMIALKDDQGAFLLCNKTFADFYNVTPENLIGKRDEGLGFSKEMKELPRRNPSNLVDEDRTQVILEDIRDNKTGEVRHFKSIKRLLRTSEGEQQLLVIANDISDIVAVQQRVVESELRLRMVMDATREGLWDWHVPTGQVIHNAQWYELLGFGDGEIGDNIQAFSTRVHPEDKPKVWQRVEELLTGVVTIYHSEHRMIRKNGSEIWVQDRGQIAERDGEGNPLRVVGAYIDITERKQSQTMLEQAMAAAQGALRAKSQFLAMMSHEIRTPLNGILGMAQLLLMPDLDDTIRQEYAKTILNSGQTLLTLLNDILDFSKIEAGRTDMIHVIIDPREVISETAAIFNELARSKGLVIKTLWHGPTDRRYCGDPVRLRQMLSNLLNNAIKFTSHGSVTIDGTERRQRVGKTTLEFSVTDTGIGISPEKHRLLFKPFSQADIATSREYGGTGLGLSIVYSLAKLMGGDVGLESEMGKGSRFWFRVDAECREEDIEYYPVTIKHHHPIDPATQLTGRILVVEDNVVNRKVIDAFLKKLGVQADFAEDGQIAVAAIINGLHPDMILMDIQMPVMDGFEATSRIRQWEQETNHPRCTIIALTADAFEEDRQRCLDSGMDDFLVKPIDIKKLTNTLSKWMGKSYE